ncbi:MAG: tetratricopeptide repeat protein [Planctomycetes bacterium]|nr:tetratricopeptide repeat protein [Planctomycetota bacterium]
MADTKLKIREFKSLDEFRLWWEGEEVTGFCQRHPEKVARLKSHRWVAPWITKHTQSEGEEVKQPAGKSFGKYIIEKKLGQGGMGAVYLAHDTVLKRKVALKVMLLKGAQAIERFNREARASAKLKHPNIISLYEVGTIDKYNYFTMEYIDGSSLDKMIKDKELTPKRTAEIIKDIANALHYAHTQEIVHRDIKPANILVDKQGKVYLTDFGLAKELSGTEHSLTMTGTIMGTADYMSPEQAEGIKRKIDARSDVFSLGATLYHALTGHTPFKGKELYQILESVVRKDPIPPCRYIKNLSKDIETICLKSMEKEQKARYQSSKELADDLTHYINGEAISARPIGFIGRIFRKAKQNKVASLSIAGVIVILIVLGIMASVSSSNTRQEALGYFNKAQGFYDKKDYNEAKVWANKALTLLPDDGAIKDLINECNDALEKISESDKETKVNREKAKSILDRINVGDPSTDDKIKAAEDALDIDPSYGDAWQVMGYAYVGKANENAQNPDKYRKLIDKAFECFSKAIEKNLSLTYSYYERAFIIAFIYDKTEEAVADFNKVIELDPESPLGYFARGTIEYYHKNYDKAIDYLAKAINLKRDYADAHFNLGNAYNNLGNYKNAIEFYKETIRLKPDFAKAHYNLGNAYRSLGNNVKAIESYKEAIRFKPDFAEVHYNLGNAYRNSGNNVKAIESYKEAIHLKPAYAEAHSNIGVAYTELWDDLLC